MKITVIFLLYSEELSVRGLIQAILSQRHPAGLPAPEWMEVVFVDNGSTDGTRAAILSEFARCGNPAYLKLLRIDRNEGIARALNHAFSQVKTPYLLTVHCDVLFGSNDYVARMLALMEGTDDAAAIAGQPEIPRKGQLPFAEKVNLVANLQDIFPESAASQSDELLPCGFVEGRCDAFRTEALRSVGFYDTTLKFAGEDQVMASRMRSAGYRLYQAPALRYTLSVSHAQNSLGKLISHQRLFGRAHPYVLLMNRNALAGVIGKEAGTNRTSRLWLRASQLGAVATYIWTPLGFLLEFDALLCWAPLLLLAIIKCAIFEKHVRVVGFSLPERCKFAILQPALDISYIAGLIHGTWLLWKLHRTGRAIE